jgi:hypothetical protein
LRIKNIGDVRLDNIYVYDYLSANFVNYNVNSVVSPKFSINPAFNGISDKYLTSTPSNIINKSVLPVSTVNDFGPGIMETVNWLNPSEETTITMTVTLLATPNNTADYVNAAGTVGYTPLRQRVEDDPPSGFRLFDNIGTSKSDNNVATFKTANQTTISGKLFIDSNNNAKQDLGEKNIANSSVIVRDGFSTKTVKTDQNGFYTANVDVGSVFVKVDKTDPNYPKNSKITTGNEEIVMSAVLNFNNKVSDIGYFAVDYVATNIVPNTTKTATAISNILAKPVSVFAASIPANPAAITTPIKALTIPKNTNEATPPLTESSKTIVQNVTPSSIPNQPILTQPNPSGKGVLTRTGGE